MSFSKFRIKFPNPVKRDREVIIHETTLFYFLCMLLLGAYDLFALLVGLFIIVLLHEFGHCIAAIYYKIEVGDIYLLPTGGCAQMDLKNISPRMEFVIAICGPLINLLLIPVFLLLIIGLEQIGNSQSLMYFSELSLLNIACMLFNLLPIFPLDGGRILRAFIQQITGDFQRATLIAVRTSQLCCIFLIGLALVKGMYLVPFILLLVIFLGQMELAMVNSADSQKTA